MMGLSLKRKGDNMIMATGKPGMIAGKKGFDSAGTKRAGNPMVQATGMMGCCGKGPTMGKGKS